jgi:DNA-binding NarL/FixJ family response regulator
MTPREQLLIDTLTRHVASAPATVDRCSALWFALASGNWEVVQVSVQQGRSVLVMSPRPEAARPLSASARKVLERSLLGERRKEIAYDLNVSVSMLALTLKASLKRLGLACKPAQVSSSLVMLIHGARGATSPAGTFIGDCDHEGRRLTIITHVLDDSILRGLSPSQRAVMSLVAMGFRCVEIASRRGRSCRTVINQVAAASRRLGVSGRFDLLRCFALGAARRPARPTAARRLASISHQGVGELPSSMCG